VWPFLRRVAQQDQRILEQQSELRGYFPDRALALTVLDVVRPYLEQAWGTSDKELPAQSRRTLYL
jgi:hypothetical protein